MIRLHRPGLGTGRLTQQFGTGAVPTWCAGTSREHGMPVSLRSVQRAVQPYRRELAADAWATLRFETPPGRQP
jgi:hypothetical protein